MTDTIYVSVPEALAIHRILIARFGGTDGVRDLGALASALARPQLGYYSDLIEEAAALMESLAIGHALLDGNKRVAFAVADVFLRLNGFKINATSAEVARHFDLLFTAGDFRYAQLLAWLRPRTEGTNAL